MSCMSNSFPSSSLLGATASPPSSLRHAKHFTPFILSSTPFELANCRDRLFVESEVWAPCHRDYSESLLVISSWEYNLNWAMWLLHDRLVCCTALNSHLHYNITLHRWLEVRAGCFLLGQLVLVEGSWSGGFKLLLEPHRIQQGGFRSWVFSLQTLFSVNFFLLPASWSSFIWIHFRLFLWLNHSWAFITQYNPRE